MDTSIYLNKLEQLAPTLPTEVGYSSSSIDEAANQLQNVIKIAQEDSCPLKPVDSNSPTPGGLPYSPQWGKTWGGTIVHPVTT